LNSGLDGVTSIGSGDSADSVRLDVNRDDNSYRTDLLEVPHFQSQRFSFVPAKKCVDSHTPDFLDFKAYFPVERSSGGVSRTGG
jgi:hypothetical protein